MSLTRISNRSRALLEFTQPRLNLVRLVRPLSFRNMSTKEVAYKLNEQGGVDYKEGKIPDKGRPQLPPDVSGGSGMSCNP